MQIFDSIVDGAQELPEGQRAAFYMAVIECLAYGREPTRLTGAARGMYVMIRPTLERSRSRSEAGRAGGRRSPSRAAAATGEALGEDEQGVKQTDEQTAKQTDKQTAKQTDKQSAKQTGKQTVKQSTKQKRSSEPSKGASYQDSSSSYHSLSLSGEGVQGEGGDDVGRVVAHLNATCGTSFRASSARTRQLVRARMAEGFGVDDLCAAVDHMAARWLRDERMRRYLRPETLFSASKFEGYLNAGMPAAPARDARLAVYDGAVSDVPDEGVTRGADAL